MSTDGAGASPAASQRSSSTSASSPPAAAAVGNGSRNAPGASNTSSSMSLALSERERAERFFNATFSVEEFFARRVDAAWEPLKEEGNDHFKRAEYVESIFVYSEALCITLGSARSMPVLFCALRRHPPGSARRAVGEDTSLFVRIAKYLQPPLGDVTMKTYSGESITVRIPNLPAAVCYSNRAAAYMKLAAATEGASPPKPNQAGLTRKFLLRALADALAACKQCPGYAKGHFRVFQALKCLGSELEANRKKHQIAMHDSYCAYMVWPAMAALAVGWVPVGDFELVYSAVRLDEGLRLLRDMRADSLAVEACLMPFHGGQSLTLGVHFPNDEWRSACFERLFFAITDNTGADQLDRRPRGIPSEKSVRATVTFLAMFLDRASKYGIRVHTLLISSNLFMFVRVIRKYFSRRGYKDILLQEDLR